LVAVEQLGPGSELAGYRIESVIGRGGMAVVYLAEHLRLGRRVALKLIAPERAQDPAFRRRFEREQRLAASMEHPHAVPVYEAGEAGDTCYIAMRYVEGTDLRAVLTREQWMQPRRAARLVEQVAGALDEAHRRGLVHRDVKPANVLIGVVGGEEWAYLTDFGATRGPAGTELTESGEWFGTVDYASPEQIQAERVDARTDVYSLGCVLFESLTGRIPFERPDQVAKLYAHLNDPPPSLVELDPELSPELDAVVSRALAKRRGDRFPSAGDLGRAAVAAATGAAPGEPERSVATGEARSGLAPGAPTRRLRRLGGGGPGARPPWGWVAGLGMVALLLAAALLFLLPSEDDGSEIVATIGVGGQPLGIDVGRDAVWVSDTAKGTLRRIDPSTNRLAGRPIQVGREATGVEAAGGSVWVADSAAGVVSRVDVDSGKVSRVSVGRRPAGLAFGQGSIWVGNIEDDSVTRIDAGSGRVLQTIRVGRAPSGIAVGEGGVWVANSLDGTVSRILPSSGRLEETIDVGTRPRGVAVGEGYVWVANTSDGTVTRIDEDTQRVVGEPIDVLPSEDPAGPAQLAVGETWVWVTNERDDSVSRLDPESGELVGDPIDVGAHPRGLALGEGSIWVANAASGTVTRIEG
jgi:YVTN family beta-propeller protein